MTAVAQGSLSLEPMPRPRRSGAGPAGERSGVLTRYPVVIGLVLLSSFPVYWTFTIASQTNEAIGQSPPPFLPGGNFFANAARVFATVDFTRALVLHWNGHRWQSLPGPRPGRNIDSIAPMTNSASARALAVRLRTTST